MPAVPTVRFMSKRVSLASLAAVLAVLAASPAAAREQLVTVSPGERLRVDVTGSGAPVVLVPGLLGSAFGFRKLVPPLVAGGCRVVVIEPLGIGGSAKPEGADYSLTAQADRIAAVLGQLDLEPAIVVAHSVAASMALRLAARHPERVRAVVSLDGGPTEAAATPGFRRAMRFSFLIKLFGGTKRIEDIVRSTLGTAAHEGGISPAEVALLEERVPDFAIDRVADAGHFVFEEKPEAVVAAIARAGHSASAPRLADGGRP